MRPVGRIHLRSCLVLTMPAPLLPFGHFRHCVRDSHVTAEIAEIDYIGKRLAAVLDLMISSTGNRPTMKITRKHLSAAVDKFIAIMGWTNLLLIVLAFAAKYLLLFGFMSAGWVEAMRLCMGLLSGKGWPATAAQNSSNILIMLLGAAYALYHMVLIFLVLATLKKGKGVTVGTCIWGLLSLAILIAYTKMGLGFRWT